ncbi:MAG: hypothetical protein ACODAC_08575 [Pseudomonadota bacterium]
MSADVREALDSAVTPQDGRAGARRARRFTAGSVAEAYAMVRSELGPEALILEQRSSAGRVEVLASVDAGGSDAPEVRERVVGRLRELGFANPVLGRLPAELRSLRDVEHGLGRLIPCTPPPEPLCGRFRLLGPPGAGKTTALIKLMAARVLRYGRLGTLLVGTDRSRLAGCEQLAASAELLGVEYLECAERELPEVLEKRRHMQLVLVDAAGMRGSTATPVAGLEDLLAVPAVWQGTALRRARSALQGHPLRGVLLTHTDQAVSLAECANVLAEWQLPLWWIGHGGDLAAELEAANPETLGRWLLGEFDRSAVAAMFAG